MAAFSAAAAAAVFHRRHQRMIREARVVGEART
jgi:hypothetical protein